jgi:glycosyltransferase involved in cell wall biosynthesis
MGNGKVLTSSSLSDRLRVVILARSLEVGGAETQLSALAKGLSPDLFDVTVACLYAKGPLLEELRSSGVQILPLEKKGRWDLLSFVFRTARSLQSLQPDILHSFLTPPNILSALIISWLKPCKLIWGIRASNMDLSNYDWTWRLSFKAECLLSGRPDLIIANSDAGRKYVSEFGFPNSRMGVIPNGIDTAHYSNAESSGDTVRREFGFEASSPIIGIVARLDPMKDHRTFLLAAQQTSKFLPEARFLCIGSGRPEYEAQLKQLTIELGLKDKVVWAGQRRDLPEIYSVMDIVTLSSAYGEGFPNTLGEAMSCSVPCVGTDVGDVAKLVGDTGIVVPVHDAIGMSKGWMKLLDESAEEQVVRRHLCRERIVQNFSLDAMIAAHTRLYQNLDTATDIGGNSTIGDIIEIPPSSPFQGN